MSNRYAPKLFPYQTQVDVWLTGSFRDGGVAIVHDGGAEKTLHLGPAVFSVLAVLIMTAHRARSRKTWSAAGFLSVEKLKKELDRLTKGLVSSEYAVKYVYRLRERLSQVKQSSKQGKKWARMFLETTVLGYRLSTHPQNVHLDLVDEESGQIQRNDEFSETNKFSPHLDFVGDQQGTSGESY